jgi:hypothetical protein
LLTIEGELTAGGRVVKEITLRPSPTPGAGQLEFTFLRGAPRTTILDIAEKLHRLEGVHSVTL